MVWAFEEKNIFKKIELVRKMTSLSHVIQSSSVQSKQNLNQNLNLHLNQNLNTSTFIKVDQEPARDIPVMPLKFHPAKKGLSSAEGQARMLHDLANIELQAMELGLRTLYDFPESPESFKEQLYQITISESEHLEMCLTEIERLGFKWGDWPVHIALWNATSPQDSLLDRLLIVHRYLEGSGLDAGDTLIRRLKGMGDSSVLKAVERINQEEVGHVLFGSQWYVQTCLHENIDPEKDYPERMQKLRWVLPKRMEPINVELRQKAGFSDLEIKYLQNLRESFLDKESPFKKELVGGKT